MIESIREFLYPLGFLSSLLFAWRFMQQWLCSELEQRSTISRSFWQLSFVGNAMLGVHALLQLQVHVCVVQAINAIISWRNLDLMRSPHERQANFRQVVWWMGYAIGGITAVFLLQGFLFDDGVTHWFRLPNWRGGAVHPINILWHLFGFIGIVLFSSRFWVQWWVAEQEQTSSLGIPFWWLSIGGGAISLIYFIHIEDPVNVLGPAVGMVPYIRNLMLIYKNRDQKISSESL